MKKHYLVDTNVIIDMLLDREDADAACAVFDGAERGEYYLHICALSFTTMFYSLRKILSRGDRINALTQLKEALEVATVDSSVIDMALKLVCSCIEQYSKCYNGSVPKCIYG